MPQCCFCNMNFPSVKISFASNFTRFLNEGNGQTAFLSPHSPTFSMAVSNDNTSITREAPGPASTGCWKAPVFPESTEGPGEGGGLQSRDRAGGPGGRRALTLLFTISSSCLWEERHTSSLLLACLSEPHADEVKAYVTTTCPH